MDNEIIMSTSPKSSISESIRTLRTNLQFASIDKEIKTFLITSSMPGEGKSFIAANLAVCFAQTGKKVLLVDCDIRKGRQHYIFKSHNKAGLSNLLLGNIEEDVNSFIEGTTIENLDILFKGITPPNPSELLGSEKNKELVKLLSKLYDIVIYDSAPVNGGLTDALIMSSLVDGVIIVSSHKVTPIAMLNNTKKNLENAGANILGVVLNKYDGKLGRHYYGHYGYYGSYY